tara:strand:+ start:361 stop:570 length:210 start_codon:yes stop_codon:yes gene_type:complete
MYEVGMGIIREYVNLGADNYIAKGEVVSIHEDAYGETLYTIMFEDGATKVYTENVMDNPRVIVTEEVIW